MIEALNSWWNYASGMLSGIMNRLIIAVIIILIGFIIGRLLGRLSYRVLHELDIDKVARQAANVKFSVEKAFSKFVAFFIYFIAIIAALSQLGLTTTILHMIAAAVLLVVVLSFVLGIKDFIPNMIAGFHLSRKSMLGEGDLIKFRGAEGKVVRMEIAETKIMTKKGDILFIPNSLLSKEGFAKLKKKSK